MKKAELQKIRSEAARRLSGMRRRAKDAQLMNVAVRGSSALVTGAAIGEMSRRGITVEVGGVPWKPVLGLVAAFGEAFTKGAVSASLGGVSAASFAVYGHEAAQKRSLIAGGRAGAGASRTTYV
jgi:hypothetical protein